MREAEKGRASLTEDPTVGGGGGGGNPGSPARLDGGGGGGRGGGNNDDIDDRRGSLEEEVDGTDNDDDDGFVGVAGLIDEDFLSSDRSFDLSSDLPVADVAAARAASGSGGCFESELRALTFA